MLNIERTQDTGQCVLRVMGEFRGDGARELFERALQEDCDKLVLDFTSCEVEDSALSTLSELLGHAQLRLAMRGLRKRQLRLLEYLGASRPASA